MATEMTSALREFALKKLTEAKQKGATLATVTAASITSNVPASTSFVFRSNAAQQQTQKDVSLETKMDSLKEANEFLHDSLTAHAAERLDASIYKMDLINESLAFTIENIQECSHVMKMLNRQLKDTAAMKNEANKTFYRPTPIIQDGSSVA
uniref:Uncharacterized protein n=1 Tax=Globisporangium ultimum (strain ATCC 200006 / CBS 805.95 / DAOM BR144) TaxID=431595 RepID=K3WIJ1_GLOUD